MSASFASLLLDTALWLSTRCCLTWQGNRDTFTLVTKQCLRQSGRSAVARRCAPAPRYLASLCRFCASLATRLTLAVPTQGACTAWATAVEASGWPTTENFCHLHNQICDTNGHITHLQLPEQMMTCDLPSEISELGYLQRLTLTQNSIAGESAGQLYQQTLSQGPLRYFAAASQLGACL